MLSVEFEEEKACLSQYLALPPGSFLLDNAGVHASSQCLALISSLSETRNSRFRQWATVPMPLTMDEEGEKKSAQSKHDVDWDNHSGPISMIAKFSHDHYYVSLVLFLGVTLGLSFIIFVPGLGNEKCAAGGQPQFTVCDESNHDWELSFLNQSRFKDAVAAIRKESMPKFNELTGRKSDSEVKARSQRSDLQGVSFIYEHENEADRDKTVLSPARIQAICKIEGSTSQQMCACVCGGGGRGKTEASFCKVHHARRRFVHARLSMSLLVLLVDVGKPPRGEIEKGRQETM